MSDSSGGLAKLVPGFEFLQGLAKSAGSAIPGVGGFGQWIAPTLDPAEIDKRIGELRTVQFWLEQNSRLLATTIQALEVQKMTLTTLKTMNLQLGEARSMFMPKGAGSALGARAADGPAAAAPSGEAEHEPAGSAPAAPARARRPTRAGATAKPSVVDPMQWWTALTGQFTELATQALQDRAGDAAKAMAGSVLRNSAEGAAATLRKAAGLPARAAGAAGSSPGAPKRRARKRVAK